jgi:hypothetical protein
MTTSVKVTAGGQAVIVSTVDEDDEGNETVNPTQLQPGESREFHATATRSIIVEEGTIGEDTNEDGGSPDDHGGGE